MDVERQTVSALKWSTVGKILSQTVSWLVTLVVIRLLLPDDYGLMASTAVVISLVSCIAELGLGASLVQARQLVKQELARVAGASILLNLISAVLVAGSAPLLAVWFDDPRLERVIQVASLQFVIYGFSALPESLAYRHMRFKLLAGIEFAAAMAASLTTLGLALSGHGVWALVYGQLAGAAVRALMLMFGGTFVRPSFTLFGIGKHFRFGSAWSAGKFAWQLTYQADVIIAGHFLSQQVVGLYAVAVQLGNLPLQKAMGMLNQVAFPAIARLQDELPRMRARLLEAVRLLCFGALPALWGICAIAEDFVMIVLGEQWSAVTLPLQAVAIVAPLRMLAAILATAVAGVGRADVDLRNTLVSLCVMPATFLLGVRWGLNGLAAAYALAVPLSFVLNFPRTSRVLGIPARQLLAAMRAPALAALAMLVVLTAMRGTFETAPSLPRLGLLVAAGAATYFGVISLLDRKIWSEVARVAQALRQP